jgi:subtilisin family serine protease
LEQDLEEGQAFWIFLDRPAFDEAALRSVEDALDPRARARRLRNRTSGSLVDKRDLPVSSESVAAIENLGYEIRVVSSWLHAVSVEGWAGDSDGIYGLEGVRRIQGVASPIRAGVPALALGSLLRDGRSERDEGDASLAEELALLEIDRVHEAGFRGTGVRVAVVDTGFNLAHPALTSAEQGVLESWDFLQGDSVVSNEGPLEEETAQDAHGPAVLGVLVGDDHDAYQGASPSVELLLAKSESVPEEAPFEEDLWIAAVEWAEQRGADIVSSSLGWADWIDSDDLDGHTAVSSAFASSFSEATGLLMIQSIGNSGPGHQSLLAPSDSPAVVAVGATDPVGSVASFSGRGPTSDGRVKPELVAPGVDIDVPVSGEVGFARVSGTSVAAPLVAGIAALALEAHPEWTLDELRSALLNSGTTSDAPDNVMGAGLPSAWKICGLPCSCEDQDGDGAWADSCGGLDCDDADPSVGPGFPEEPYDGRDQDCDGVDLDDLDGDGFAGGPVGPDCGDENPAVFPAPLREGGSVEPRGGHELCSDSWDNDCDGLMNGADPDCSEELTGGVIETAGETGFGAGGGCSMTLLPPEGWVRKPVRVLALTFLFLVLLGRRRNGLFGPRASSPRGNPPYMVPGSRVPSSVQ